MTVARAVISPRRPEPSASQSPSRFREGDEVEARFQRGKQWYKARIRKAHRGDNTYDLDYEDGDREQCVDARYIKALAGRSMSRSPHHGNRLREGTKVEARYRGKSRYYPGQIRRDRGDGTFDIAYDDGEHETRVREEYIKCMTDSDDDRRRCKSLRVGDRVEARQNGRTRYYPGTVARVHSDGTYDIDYDDGEKETYVKEEYVKSAGGGSRSPSPGHGRLRQGAMVEARYRGRPRYYPGKIRRDHGDGTFDVDYDDGEREARVKAEYIKFMDSESEGRGTGLHSGDEVEARYQGRAYRRGVVARVRVDGTYDVDYEGGEQETRIGGSHIKLARRGGKRSLGWRSSSRSQRGVGGGDTDSTAGSARGGAARALWRRAFGRRSDRSESPENRSLNGETFASPEAYAALAAHADALARECERTDRRGRGFLSPRAFSEAAEAAGIRGREANAVATSVALASPEHLILVGARRRPRADVYAGHRSGGQWRYRGLRRLSRPCGRGG